MLAMHCNTPATNIRFGHLPQSLAFSDLEFEAAWDFNQITTTTHRQNNFGLTRHLVERMNFAGTRATAPSVVGLTNLDLIHSKCTL